MIQWVSEIWTAIDAGKKTTTFHGLTIYQQSITKKGKENKQKQGMSNELHEVKIARIMEKDKRRNGKATKPRQWIQTPTKWFGLVGKK